MLYKILGGRYEILEEIGKGGMAHVYKARCRLLNRVVAVKVLRDDLDGGGEFIKRFNVEAQAAASLTHPNIVSVYDVGNEGGTHYIVMEYVEGKTLKAYIGEKKVIAWREAVKISLEICKGLSAAHKNHIVHRDIKPHNIIVTEAGEIKVTDFGIARASTSSTVMADDDVLGSVHYFSPEQARGGYVDEKSDIYSLGTVMYEMLTGKVPFEGDMPVAIAMKHLEEPPASLCDINISIPKSLEDVVLKAMSKDTRSRYQSVGELADDLKSIAGNPEYAVQSGTAIPFEADKTKKIPAVKKEVVVDAASGKIISAAPPQSVREADDMARVNKKGDKKAIVFAVITSLFIVGALSVFALYLLGYGGSGKTILVPSLVGKSFEEAQELARADGFTVEIASYKESDKQADTVLSQDPKEKLVVQQPGVIKVVLSGEEVVEIVLKDYENKRARDSKVELENSGISVVEREEESGTVAEGYIIRQDPKAGAKLKEGDKVTFYISKGVSETANQVSVPNLLGKTESEAKRALEEVKLSLGRVDEAESDKPKGQVISQGLQGYVNEKTAVNITISKGKEDSSGTGSNVVPAKQKNISVDLSSYKSTVKIDVMANGKSVYTTTHDAEAYPDFSATLQGTGVVTYDIFIDGTKIGSKTVDFDK